MAYYAASFLIYFGVGFGLAWLFRAGVPLRTGIGIALPSLLFALCWWADRVSPPTGMIHFGMKDIWALPGIFLLGPILEERALAPPETGAQFDWTRDLPDGRRLGTWHQPNRSMRTLGWLGPNGAMTPIFEYGHEKFGIWASEFKDGAPDGRGGFVLAANFLTFTSEGAHYPLLRFDAKGQVDWKRFESRSRKGLDSPERVLVSESGEVWLLLSRFRQPALWHWRPDGRFDREYDTSEFGEEFNGKVAEISLGGDGKLSVRMRE